jgi:hypothetical protein
MIMVDDFLEYKGEIIRNKRMRQHADTFAESIQTWPRPKGCGRSSVGCSLGFQFCVGWLSTLKERGSAEDGYRFSADDTDALQRAAA